MKNVFRSLAVFTLVIFLLTACNSKSGNKQTEVNSGADDPAAATTESTAPPNTLAADSLAQFKEPLKDFLMTRNETVYQYDASDINAKILCAKSGELSGGMYYIFEGEYKDEQGHLQYVNRAYYLTNDKLAECYDEVMPENKPILGTIWLKSPVKLGDKWQTEYLDKNEGFLNAVATVTNIQKDFVEVVMQIEDDTIKAEDRYNIVKQFHRDDVVIGNVIKLSNGKLATKTGDASYIYKDDSDYLNRFTSEKSPTYELFVDGTLSIEERLGRYRKAVRESKDDAQIVVALSDGFQSIIEKLYKDMTIYADMLNYALAHSKDQLPIVEQYYQMAVKDLEFDEYYYKSLEVANLDWLNECLYFAQEDSGVDLDAIRANKNNPIPQPGDFLGAKYYEKIFRENGYFVGRANTSAEEEYYSESEFFYPKSPAEVSRYFIEQIDDQYKEAKTFLKLVSLKQQHYLDFQFASNKPYPQHSERDYLTYYINLLSQAEEYYGQLSGAYKEAATAHMNVLLIDVMKTDENVIEKYNSFVTLAEDGYIDPVLAENGYINISCQFDKDLYTALEDYVKRNKDGYYAPHLEAMLKSLKEHDMYYNLELSSLLEEIMPEDYYIAEGTPSLTVLMQDLEYYEEVSKNNEIAQSDDFVRVNTVQALIDQIAPGKKIKLKRGTYVLTGLEDYLTDYVKLEGGKLTIHDVDGLTIASPNGLSQILSDDIDSVLHFEKCSNVNLSGLRIGHLAQEGCMGYSLELEDCNLFKIDSCVLFGSGYNSLVARRVQNLDIQNSVMSDAQNLGVALFDSKNARLNNLIIADCGGSALYCDNSKAILLKDVKTLNNGGFDRPNYHPIHAVASDIVLNNFEITEGPQYENLAEKGATITNEE